MTAVPGDGQATATPPRRGRPGPAYGAPDLQKA